MTLEEKRKKAKELMIELEEFNPMADQELFKGALEDIDKKEEEYIDQVIETLEAIQNLQDILDKYEPIQ